MHEQFVSNPHLTGNCWHRVDLTPEQVRNTCCFRTPALAQPGRNAATAPARPRPPTLSAVRREWIAERHGVDPDRVLVTNGSLPGLNLVLGHFATRGRILAEAPTYDRPLKIAARLGAEVRAIPQDESGLDVDALERELARDR